MAEWLTGALRSYRRLLFVVFCLAAILAAGCSQLAQKERELTFRIEPGTARWYTGLPEGIVELHIPLTEDRQSKQLHAWWWPSEASNAPALLYLHGARWNLTGHLFRIRQLRDFGFSVLAIDYRGFGKSGGELPSEASVYEDARAAWKHLTKLQPDSSRRFIYGHSLGGAVAVDLAHQLSRAESAAGAKGLIIESSFTTLADIAKTFTYPWLPMRWLLSQQFDSINKIGDVNLPVLIVHGTEDRYVPPHFSKALFEAAKGEKRLLLIEGGSHNNSMRLGEEEYRKTLRELFGWEQQARQEAAPPG